MKRTRMMASALLSMLLACALVTPYAFAESAPAETLANDGYIEIDITKIDGIENMTCLNILLRVSPKNKDTIGLYVAPEGGSSSDVVPLTIGKDSIKLVDNVLSAEPIKTYRFIGDGNANPNYQDGIKLSINGQDLKSPIAIECGNDGTGLTFDTSRWTGDKPMGAAIGLSNKARVQMALNNDVQVISEAGYAGINVPGDVACELDLCGPVAEPARVPTLTATAGTGGAGIGGNAGHGTSRVGQASGTVSLRNHLIVYALGGEPQEGTYSGGAGIGGGSAFLNSKYSDEATGGNAGPVMAEGNVVVIARGQGDGAGIGGGGGGSIADQTGGNAGEFEAIADASGTWPTISASSDGRGAGIGGGGGYKGGDGFLASFGNSNLEAESSYGAGIGGGAGNVKGGECGSFSAQGGTIRALCTDGHSSGVGGGAGGVKADGGPAPSAPGGNGNSIVFGGGSVASTPPLYATIGSANGNDIGAAAQAVPVGNDPDKIVINGGSIVAGRFSVEPTDGTRPVFPVVIPKASDTIPPLTLTGHLGFEVPVSSTATYHVASVDGDDPEHGASFNYAAQLWLPEGSVKGIIGASVDGAVSIEGGFVDVVANMTPDFDSGENVVSFVPYKLTLDYAMPGSGLTPINVDVAGGSAYALPSEPKVYTTWRLDGWSDGITQYALGADYTMPWEDTALTGVWVQRSLSEILIPGKTDDLSALSGKENAQIGLDVELSKLLEVGYADANGSNYKALTKDKEYKLTSSSTIITLQSTWLSTLKSGDYLLRVTYTDHSYDIPFTILADPADVPSRFEGGSIYTKGTNKPIVFVADKPVALYDRTAVDGVTLTSSQVTITSGPTIATLAPAYLETLSVGIHEVRVYFTDGTFARGTFEVKAAATPVPTDPSKLSKTGDGMAAPLPIALGILAVAVLGAGLASTTRARRKNAGD